MFSPASRLAVLSAAVLCGLATAARAAIITEWTFETSQPTTTGPVTAEVGTGTASTTHASTTVVSSLAGNGSAHSLSSTVWAIGDYYQFTFSPTGSTLYLTFDQTSSNTGPRDFKIQTSTDGSTFTDLSTYSVLANGGAPNASWTSTINQPAYTFGNMILPANTTAIRLVVNSNVAANGTTLASTGTDRVDNVIFSNAPVPIPEPASLSVFALGGALLLRRRK
jgi:hypothetical protein